MAKLIYASIGSVDGYVADTSGNFEWAVPDEEVFGFVNQLEKPIGTYLFGRKMYETMVYWETADVSGGPEYVADFAEIWRGAEKIVYSTTLESAASERTRIERAFDPDAVRQLKATADRDISVGGSDLAGQAIRAGLVEEYHLFFTPVMVGGGLRSLPEHVRIPLELVDEHRFGNGVVHLHYRAGS